MPKVLERFLREDGLSTVCL